MTVCNMSIEGGARAGLIAPDETTLEYLEGREYAPKGEDGDRAVEEWRALRTDEGAEFDKEVVIQAEDLVPYVSWGTTPAQTVGIDDAVPEPQNAGHRRALKYMNLEPGTPIREIEVDTVFLGSCTNARIEDLRAAARVLEGQKVKEGIRAMVVPGSMRLRASLGTIWSVSTSSHPSGNALPSNFFTASTRAHPLARRVRTGKRTFT